MVCKKERWSKGEKRVELSVGTFGSRHAGNLFFLDSPTQPFQSFRPLQKVSRAQVFQLLCSPPAGCALLPLWSQPFCLWSGGCSSWAGSARGGLLRYRGLKGRESLPLLSTCGKCLLSSNLKLTMLLTSFSPSMFWAFGLVVWLPTVYLTFPQVFQWNGFQEGN